MIANLKYDPRNTPRYRPAEAARYLWVNPVTLSNWAKRQHIFPDIRRHPGRLTFFNLMEAHVLASLRLQHRIPMAKVHRAIEWIRKQYDTEHPLLHPDLATDGLDLFIQQVNSITSASESGQQVMREVVEAYLSRIGRDEKGQPVQFFPFVGTAGRMDTPKFIVLDPRVEDGRPVVAGTRISPGIIFERFKAGDEPELLAEDYNLELPQVYEAIRAKEFERKAA